MMIIIMMVVVMEHEQKGEIKYIGGGDTDGGGTQMDHKITPLPLA